MRVAKVIATSFVPRRVREETGLSGNPVGYFSHSQNFPTKESVVDLINFNIECELKCNPGDPVDLIIVNSDVGWQDGNSFLDSIDGKILKYGKIHILHRANLGWSFGAYNHAFKMLGNDYDYFIFTEDDVVISRDGYASTGIEHFNRTKNCGFLAYLGLAIQGLDIKGDDAFAAHGGVGITSSAVLNEVVKNYGSLPHCGENDSQEYTNILRSEMAFTNKIYKLGYELVNIPENIKLYDYAYDMMRGIDVKRYPSLAVKMMLKIKQKAYNQKIIRSIYQSCKKAISK
ncbi:MAG: hypothetical protein EPN22_13405 [Nitrospirae bacterium]|nr:MAG: hypothetical protein EPN22_13405 [Nitrospirota bacterium]